MPTVGLNGYLIGSRAPSTGLIRLFTLPSTHLTWKLGGQNEKSSSFIADHRTVLKRARGTCPVLAVCCWKTRPEFSWRVGASSAPLTDSAVATTEQCKQRGLCSISPDVSPYRWSAVATVRGKQWVLSFWRRSGTFQTGKRLSDDVSGGVNKHNWNCCSVCKQHAVGIKTLFFVCFHTA